MEETKSLKLSQLVLELDSINCMLDDFSTDKLIEWSPKMREIEKEMLKLATEIVEESK